jgi:hypothetical protein
MEIKENLKKWPWNFEKLPYSEIEGNTIKIHNVRDFKYKTPTDFEESYFDKVYFLDRLQKVYLLVEPFGKIRGPAHTLLCFEFDDGNYLALSVEVRRFESEKFSLIKGFRKYYQLLYVIGTEDDLVKLRSNYRKDKTYLYPLRVSPQKVRALFLDMLKGANKSRLNPEYYHTLKNTCTTKLVDHANNVSPKKLPFSLKYIFPHYADKYLYDLGLIDTDLPFEKAREKFQINSRAEKYHDSSEFSKRIRES